MCVRACVPGGGGGGGTCSDEALATDIPVTSLSTQVNCSAPYVSMQ